MIIINTRDFKSIDQALKYYKQKHNKIGIVKELRDRQEYVKPSIKQRDKLLKAQYKQKLRNASEE
jgi:small subunit ribosomal protein S21